LLKCRVPLEDADRCDLLGCERWDLITLQSHSIDNEKKRNLARVRRDGGRKGTARRLRREGALSRACCGCGG